LGLALVCLRGCGGGNAPPINFVIVLGPTRPMLHALMPGGEEVAVHTRRTTALLDELELHVSRVGQCDRDVYIVVAPTAIREAGDEEAIGVEPGPDAADLYP